MAVGELFDEEVRSRFQLCEGIDASPIRAMVISVIELLEFPHAGISATTALCLQERRE